MKITENELFFLSKEDNDITFINIHMAESIVKIPLEIIIGVFDGFHKHKNKPKSNIKLEVKKMKEIKEIKAYMISNGTIYTDKKVAETAQIELYLKGGLKSFFYHKLESIDSTEDFIDSVYRNREELIEILTKLKY